MLSKTTRKWQGDFIELLMLVYTSAKLSNYFLGAVSSRFCATSKSNKCIIISLWKSTDSLFSHRP